MVMIRTRIAGCHLTVNMYNRTIGHVQKWLYCRRHGALSIFSFYLYICCIELLVSTYIYKFQLSDSVACCLVH